MKGYWITFDDGTKGYCEGHSPHDAMTIAEHITGKKARLEDGWGKYNPQFPQLPYPANPVIWQFKHPVYGVTPTFCHDPEGCKGKSCCLKPYACTE